MKKSNVVLIIPSLDPDEKLGAVIKEAVEAGIEDIVLVDDGSSQEKRHYFTELDEKYPQVTLLTHEINLGKGAALKTAFTYVLENHPGSVGVVTADGDGQHRIEDILACMEGVSLPGAEPAVILGCRDFSLENVPAKSRFGNRMTSAVFRLFFGMKLSDTQTGLRGIPIQYLETLLTALGSRYEYETNMLILMGQQHIPYREIAIETLYYDENSATHFRPIRDSLRVYGLILKYAASSLILSLVDLLVFYILGKWVFTGGTRMDVLLSTVGARAVSSIVNFAMNRQFVFKSRTKATAVFLRYVCLAVPIMLVSGLLVHALSSAGVGQLGRTLIKIPVDTLLFLISFRVQRSWVFSDRK